MADFAFHQYVLDLIISNTSIEAGFKSHEVTLSPAINITKSIVMTLGNHAGIHGGPTGDITNQTVNNITFDVKLINSTTARIRIDASATNAERKYGFQIWEYTGAPGGANEFVISMELEFTVNNLNTTIEVPATNFTNFDKCLPFPKGLLSDNNTISANFVFLQYTYLNAGTPTVGVKRKNTGTNMVWTGYLIEFKGSNWTIARASVFSDSFVTGQNELTLFSDQNLSIPGDILNWNNTFLVITVLSNDFEQNRNWQWIGKKHASLTTIAIGETEIDHNLFQFNTVQILAVSNPNMLVEHTRFNNTGLANSFTQTINPTASGLVIQSEMTPIANNDLILHSRLSYFNSPTQITYFSHRAVGVTFGINQQIISFPNPSEFFGANNLSLFPSSTVANNVFHGLTKFFLVPAGSFTTGSTGQLILPNDIVYTRFNAFLIYNGINTIELPIKLFQIRMTIDAWYLSFTVPNAGVFISFFTNILNKQVYITRSYISFDGTITTATAFSGTVTGIRLDETWNEYLAVIESLFQNPPPSSVSHTVTNPVSFSTTGGIKTYRAELNPLVRPGDTITVRNDTYVVGEITWFVDAVSTIAEYSEKNPPQILN